MKIQQKIGGGVLVGMSGCRCERRIVIVEMKKKIGFGVQVRPVIGGSRLVERVGVGWKQCWG